MFWNFFEGVGGVLSAFGIFGLSAICYGICHRLNENNSRDRWWHGLVVILALPVLFLTGDVAEKVKKRHGERQNLEGKIYGLCMSFSLFGLCWQDTANDLYKYCIQQLRRCKSIKIPPEIGSDDLWYKQSDFAEFTYLCTMKYVQFADIPESSAQSLYDHCTSTLRAAKDLSRVRSDYYFDGTYFTY